ncbi:MAG: hypothetical protein ABSC72_12970 [Methylovirgula sp.]|jgi:hypothetical protein
MRKSVIAIGFVALLLAGNAQPASAHAPTKATRAHVAAVHHPAHRRVAHARPYSNYAQLIQMMFSEARSLGYAGPLPKVASLHFKRGAPASSDDTWSYDTSASDNQAADTQAAIDAQNAQMESDNENQAIQEMNDTNALNASMAAAEEQNDEAVAATQQTEINAGN